MRRKQLQSESGETLAETLVATLVAALGMLLLASMIMCGSKMVTRSQNVMESFYNGISQLEEKDTAADSGINKTNGNVSIDTGEGNISIPVTIYQEEETGVAAYEETK